MSNLELYTRFSFASSLAFGGLVAGIGLAAFAPKRPWGRAAVLIAASLATLGLGELMIPESLAGLSFIAFGVSTIVFLAGFESVQRAALRIGSFASRRRFAGGIAIAVALAAWGFESWRYDRSTEELMDLESQRTEVVSQAAISESSHHALTDRGSPIALNEATNPLDAAATREMERNSTVLNSHSGEFIRRAPADDRANCHGWTFAAGRFHIHGSQVEKILTDNDYRQVAQPQPGDICIYRDASRAIAHSGIVRAVVDSQSVLLESKWGRLGVYLHDTDETSYGKDYAYYRTTRGGHLLHGVETSPTPGTNAVHGDGD